MKNFVVGIDFTKADDLVLNEALELAKALGATLHLVHVFPPETTAIDYIAYVPVDPEKREAEFIKEKEQLLELASELQKQGLAVEGKMVVDKASRGLMNYAAELEEPAIVVGTHSKTLMDRLDRALLGSTAEKVARKSVVPVLIVPTIAAGESEDGEEDSASDES